MKNIDVKNANNPPWDRRPYTLAGAIAQVIEPMKVGGTVHIGMCRNLSGATIKKDVVRVTMHKITPKDREYAYRGDYIWRVK